jgi:hypothetical protein
MVPNMSASLIPPLPYLLLDRLGDHGLLSLPIMDCALSVLLKISRRLCVYFRRYVLYFLLPNADKTSVTDGNIVKSTGYITVNLKVNLTVNL